MTFRVLWPEEPVSRLGLRALVAASRLIPVEKALQGSFPVLLCGDSAAFENAPSIVRIPSGGRDYDRADVEWRTGQEGSRTTWTADHDIAGVAGRLLRLDEEVRSKKRDARGRFLARFAESMSSGQFSRAVVDRLGQALAEALKSALAAASMPYVQFRPWPKGAPLAISLTHDVDQVRKYTLYRLRRELVHPRPRFLRRMFRSFVLRVRPNSTEFDPYWTFPRILEMEARSSAKSAFFMGTFADGMGLEYSLERSRSLQRLARDLARGGFEVGLHAHGGTPLDLQAMRSDKERLDRFLAAPSQGVRQHDLRFSPPRTWQIQERSGFVYDSSVGFADYVGFRAGTSVPYRPLADRDDFWEIPMHVMDATLRSYMDLDADSAWTRIFSLIEEAEHVGGLLVVNWHNNTFEEEEPDPLADVYARLLSEGLRRSASFLLPREALSRWRACSSLSISLLERDRRGWNVLIHAPHGADHVLLEHGVSDAKRETALTASPGEPIELAIAE